MSIRKTLAVLMLVLSVAVVGNSQSRKSTSSSSAGSVEALLGRWDLTLRTPGHAYPSWLELREENGQLKAEFVGRWGNARPLPSAEFSAGHLKFVSPKDEEGAKEDMVFQGALAGRILSGTVNGPDGKTWNWSGRRAPALKPAATPTWGSPIELFNGKDLTGWHPSSADAGKSWKVENGLLTTPGNGPELINDSKFEDFRLRVEFNCGPESNSGVYLRGRYEVQIETDSIQEPASHHMGGVYGFLAPTPELPRRPGQWQTYDITLIGRNVTIVQNGQTIIDNKEIRGITGGALDSSEGQPGPIYLQGSEKGRVQFRKIEITPASK